MYYVVEFLNEKTVAVGPEPWMLSLNLCVWPPETPEWRNKRAKLVKIKAKPEECFVKYDIKCLGSSASLERANQKAQKAVDTSDINTDTSITKFGRPKRKRKRAHVYTSESDDVKSSAEDEEPSAAYIAPPKPPALRKEAFLATTPPMPTIPTSTPQLLPIESEVMQPSMQQVTETPRGRPEAIEEKDTSGLGVKALLRLNAEFHKQILRKLKIIETELAIQKELLSHHTSGASQNQLPRLQELPFDLPIVSEDALLAAEEFLKIEANKDILIRHLRLVGGAELDLAVRGILRRCMTNGLASTFSYNGLRDKRQFKSLMLKKVVFSSVQVLFPAVTEAEFAKIVGDWFRYAPRKKGGSKQRGTVEEKEQLDP